MWHSRLGFLLCTMSTAHHPVIEMLILASIKFIEAFFNKAALIVRTLVAYTFFFFFYIYCMDISYLKNFQPDPDRRDIKQRGKMITQSLQTDLCQQKDCLCACNQTCKFSVFLA